MPERPTIAELRTVTQPPSVTGRRNAEHWTGDLYQRRLSPYLTRLLIGTAITANGVTVLMIVTGAAAGAALLLPGLLGAVLAALLGQLQMLWDCCDGEVARWRQTFSPVGFFLDKLGHTVAESSIPLALGVRADAGFGSLGGWTSLGAVLAVLVLVNKSLNDAVHVARAANGLPRLQDRAEEAAPQVSAVRRLRSLARFVPFHRVFHSIEMTMLALVAAVVDAIGGGLDGTRLLVAVLVPVAVVTVLGHLAAILTSSRLR
ncbi:MAG: CDP-alcohol phosphatidyltransferase family protein [Sporichthyaceae bacterium]